MSEKNLSPAHVNVEAFLAAKDAGREAFRDDKDWHDITTAMLEAYARSSTALPAQPELQENSKPNQNLELQPDTVNSVRGLHLLDAGTVVRAEGGSVWKKFNRGMGVWFRVGDSLDYEASVISLPATVLWRPNENS